MSHDDNDIISKLTFDASKSMIMGKESIIRKAIIDSDTDMVIVNLKVIKERGRFEIYPDKTEVFVWDGKPLIQFEPMEIKQDGCKVTLSQPYRLLS